MGLRTQAAADLKTILEDTEGFGYSITLTDPAGNTAALTGFSTDISEVIDPDTGVAVAGRLASVALRISSITAAGLSMPRQVADETGKPWRVTFDDIDGSSHTFTVLEPKPDRAIGILVLLLEAYG